MGFIIPYVLLILVNVCIIYKATKYERLHKNVVQSQSQPTVVNETRSARKKAEMTRSILIITFLYIIVTLPGTILTGFFFISMMSLDIGLMLLNIIDIIHFSYPAFNFFILYFSNKLFCQEVKIFFGRMKRNKVDVTLVVSNYFS